MNTNFPSTPSGQPRVTSVSAADAFAKARRDGTLAVAPEALPAAGRSAEAFAHLEAKIACHVYGGVPVGDADLAELGESFRRIDRAGWNALWCLLGFEPATREERLITTALLQKAPASLTLLHETSRLPREGSDGADALRRATCQDRSARSGPGEDERWERGVGTDPEQTITASSA